MITRMRLWATIAGVLTAGAPAFAFHPHLHHHHHRSQVQVVPVVPTTQVATQTVMTVPQVTTQLVTTQAVTAPQVTTQLVAAPQVATQLVTVPQVTMQLAATSQATTQAASQSTGATIQLSPLDLSSLIGGSVTAVQLRGIREDLAALRSDVAAIRQSTANMDANIQAFVKRQPGQMGGNTGNTGGTVIELPNTRLLLAPGTQQPAQPQNVGVSDCQSLRQDVQELTQSNRALAEQIKELVKRVPVPTTQTPEGVAPQVAPFPGTSPKVEVKPKKDGSE